MVGFWGGGKETQYVFMAGKEGADGMDGLACVRVAGIELFVLPVPSGWEVFFFCRDFLSACFSSYVCLLRMHKYLSWQACFGSIPMSFLCFWGGVLLYSKYLIVFVCYLGC